VLELGYIINLDRPGGSHHAIGLRPLGHSMSTIQHRKIDNRMRPVLLRLALKDVLIALDYVHTECKIIHTGKRTFNGANTFFFRITIWHG
jgi:hypothetical protein